MKNLIKALQIFLKYRDEDYPTHCEDEVLMVLGITEEEVRQCDKEELNKLGFMWSEGYKCWVSYHYGSA